MLLPRPSLSTPEGLKGGSEGRPRGETDAGVKRGAVEGGILCPRARGGLGGWLQQSFPLPLPSTSMPRRSWNERRRRSVVCPSEGEGLPSRSSSVRPRLLDDACTRCGDGLHDAQTATIQTWPLAILIPLRAVASVPWPSVGFIKWGK